MNMPGFTAETSLYKTSGHYQADRSRGHYRHGQLADSHGQLVVPAIPYCGNCDWILDNCARNGWRPRGLCNYCARGICYDEPSPGDNP